MIGKVWQCRGVALAVGLAVIAMGTSRARANLTLTLASVQPVPASVDYAYTYDVTLGPNAQIDANGGGLNSADFLTVYDFAGLAGTPSFTPIASGASFTISEQPVGPTPPTQVPPDDPTMSNVTFTYNGATISNPSTAAGILLGTITLTSTYDNTLGSVWASAATQAADNPVILSNGTSANVGPAAQAAVPEPSTLVSGMGALLIGYGLHRLRRRRARKESSPE